MRLNPDCIRDILLTVEEYSSYGSTIKYEISDDFPRLKKYSVDEFYYHANQCKANNFFLSSNISPVGDVLIGNLSPKAHEFLANTRQDNNWNKIKDIALKAGSIALPVLQQVAAKYIRDKI